eukprot:c15659_g1_i1.p1 GENE.c15659_g1_i1~~c15659_g1_i1.p1  ORF type:complete len:202 (-),score=35.99 c15659_g1_i1:46-651(-)
MQMVPKEKWHGLRFTFLVNVWLNYRPVDTHTFPAKVARKLGLSNHADLPTNFTQPSAIASHIIPGSPTPPKLEFHFGAKGTENRLLLPLPDAHKHESCHLKYKDKAGPQILSSSTKPAGERKPSLEIDVVVLEAVGVLQKRRGVWVADSELRKLVEDQVGEAKAASSLRSSLAKLVASGKLKRNAAGLLQLATPTKTRTKK